MTNLPEELRLEYIIKLQRLIKQHCNGEKVDSPLYHGSLLDACLTKTQRLSSELENCTKSHQRQNARVEKFEDVFCDKHLDSLPMSCPACNIEEARKLLVAVQVHGIQAFVDIFWKYQRDKFLSRTSPPATQAESVLQPPISPNAGEPAK